MKTPHKMDSSMQWQRQRKANSNNIIKTSTVLIKGSVVQSGESHTRKTNRYPGPTTHGRVPSWNFGSRSSHRKPSKPADATIKHLPNANRREVTVSTTATCAALLTIIPIAAAADVQKLVPFIATSTKPNSLQAQQRIKVDQHAVGEQGKHRTANVKQKSLKIPS